MADIQTLWQMAQAQENNRHPVAGVLSSIAGGMKKAYDEKPQREMQRLEMAAKLLQIQKEQQAMAQQQEANRQIQEYQAFQQRQAANGQLGLDMYKPNPFDKRTTGKFANAINDEGSLLGKLMDASDYSAMSRKWDDPNKKISLKYGPTGTTMDVTEGTDLDERYKTSQIKANEALAGKRNTEAANVEGKGQTDKDKLIFNNYNKLKNREKAAYDTWQKMTTSKGATWDQQNMAQKRYQDAQRESGQFFSVNKAVIQKLKTNEGVSDTGTGTTAPIPKDVTEEDILYTMNKHNMTREQVLTSIGAR